MIQEDEEEDDFLSLVAIAQTTINNNMLLLKQMDKKIKIDHRQLPRSQRRKFRHNEAVDCIHRDYLGPDALFGIEFTLANANNAVVALIARRDRFIELGNKEEHSRLHQALIELKTN